MTHDHGAAVVAAFPPALRLDALHLAAVIPTTSFTSMRPFTVVVEGVPVDVPYRIYNGEPAVEIWAELTPARQVMLHCWYARHHDGYVRQRHLAQIIGTPLAWVAPFVVAPIGEYVREIVALIRRTLVLDVPGPAQQVYGRFAAENLDFINLTAQRVASYWDCYHRYWHPTLAAYPGTAVIDSLRAAARQSS